MTTVATPRFWPNLTGELTPKAELAVKMLFNNVQQHDDAIVALKGQLTAAVLAQTTINQTITPTTPTTPATSNLGLVNNQTGTAYTTMTTDLGALITIANAAPFLLTLNSTVSAAFYCFVENIGPALATITPTLGNLNGAVSLDLDASQSCYLAWDGANWWAATSPKSANTFAAVTHQFLTSYTGSTGNFTAAQPAIADVSGLATALGLLAPIAGPTFTGVVTQPDATVLTAPTTTSSATAGGATALPATPAGYLTMSIGGANFKVPYFAL